MYFEAELKGKKYGINVSESRTHWLVSLKEAESLEQKFQIAKSDYQRMDDAILLLFENSSYILDVVGSGTEYNVYTRGSFRTIHIYNDELLLHESLKGGSALGESSQVSAGMPGKIVSIHVKVGDRVSAGQTLLVMEAMKMENDLKASKDVTIKEVKVEVGQSVDSGATLILFETE